MIETLDLSSLRAVPIELDELRDAITKRLGIYPHEVQLIGRNDQWGRRYYEANVATDEGSSVRSELRSRVGADFDAELAVFLDECDYQLKDERLRGYGRRERFIR